MSVRFIIGRARSGKTHHCLEEITRACVDDPLGPPVIYLVPEQATYSAEKALLTHGHLTGYTRAQVMSFTRLEQYLFANGPAPTRPRLSATHRDILVTLLVAQERRANPESLVSASGMEEALADFVSETKQYATPPDALLQAAELLEKEARRDVAPSTGLLETKLLQLARLIERFNAITRERFEDPQDTLLGLADLIRASVLLQGVDVYIDGFIGLTPVEEKVVVALAQRAKSLHVTILGDPSRTRRLLAKEPLRRDPVFQPVEETFQRLQRLFVENGAKQEPPLLLGGSMQGSVAQPLVLVEEKFLARKAESHERGDAVELHEVDTPREEARLAVEVLARWMKDHGWAPAEVGILTRDLETYTPHLIEAFHALRLPFFIDRHEPLETHPLVLGIQTLIRAALQPQNQSHLINLAKSGFLEVSRRQADLLEHHVRQYPRTMREWYSERPWAPPPTRSPFDDEDDVQFDEEQDFDRTIDRTRRAIIDPVKALREKLGGSEGPFRQLLAALVETITNATDIEGQSEVDRRILGRIGELLGEAFDAAGHEVLPWELAGDLVLRTLTRLSLPRIPPMIGEIFVGQVDRSRQPRLRGVVVLGLNEGVFPRVGANMSLLNDQERDVLEGMGLDLRPNSRRQFEREALYAYRAFSAASDCLALMRARGQHDGSAYPASAFWQSIAALFDVKTPEPVPPLLHPARCWRARELAASAVRLLDETHLHGPQEFLKASKLFHPRMADALQAEAERVLHDARWQNEAELPADSLAIFLDHRLRLSVSQLESFSRCPFQHYVRFLLRPAELMQPRFEARDAGNFAHAVLRNLTRLLRERAMLGKELTEDEFETFFAIASESPVKRIIRSGLVESPTGRFLFEKLQLIVQRTAKWLVESFAALPMRPVTEEVMLSHAADAPLHPLRIEDFSSEWDYEVRGQIDRVDRIGFASPETGEMVVVDYKLRPRGFNYSTWEGGENLQLPIYLLAVNQNNSDSGKVRAAGGLYLDIVPRGDEDENRRYKGIIRSSTILRIFPNVDWRNLPFMDGSNGDPIEKPRSSGSVITDTEFEGVLRRTEEMVKELGRQIISGDVRLFPSRYGTTTACSYCSYAAICRMDYRVNRANPKLARDRRVILEELRGDAADE
jgi:ATP-dependent helicase/nuclease subunit B